MNYQWFDLWNRKGNESAPPKKQRVLGTFHNSEREREEIVENLYFGAHVNLVSEF